MSVQISRILHAGYVFECEGVQIAFDPIFENPFSRNCYAFPDIRFDLEKIKNLHFAAVFISHYHDDHCSLESLNLLSRETPIYIYCLHEELLGWIRELGFTQVFPLDLNIPVEVGPWTVTPRRALDADVDSLFQVTAAGYNFLNVVDSWIDEETLHKLVSLGPWDMIMWPFQTMRELEVLSPHRAAKASRTLPPEWVKQIQALNPRTIVPSSCQFRQESWSWYNHAFFPITYQQFENEISSSLPGVSVIRLNPSESILFNNHLEKASPLPWIIPQGDQNVDYEFIEDLVVPPTSEVARHFPALNKEQTERVYEYCRLGLPAKYAALEISEEVYFQKPRHWRLSVYDHKGREMRFDYLLEGSRMKSTVSEDLNLAWVTEIPVAKLYGALETGESLTSLYVRINDCSFSPETERELQGVDLLQDPLLRCLFNVAFGSYQKEQLRRIQGR